MSSVLEEHVLHNVCKTL